MRKFSHQLQVFWSIISQNFIFFLENFPCLFRFFYYQVRVIEDKRKSFRWRYWGWSLHVGLVRFDFFFVQPLLTWETDQFWSTPDILFPRFLIRYLGKHPMEGLVTPHQFLCRVCSKKRSKHMGKNTFKKLRDRTTYAMDGRFQTNNQFDVDTNSK